MKKILALLTVIAMLAALCSCGSRLIRKTSETYSASGDKKAESAPAEDTEDATESAADTTGQDPDPGKNGLRCTEDEAYEILTHSFPDYDMDLVKIEKTGAMVAENTGTEYYIFNVSLPKIPESVETEAPDDPDGGEDGGDVETEPAAPEMEDPVPYYVSVNGVVHTEVADGNVDTEYAKAALLKNFGDRDPETGYAYELKYVGLVVVDNGGDSALCYKFDVYKINTSGAEPVEEFADNYFVTVDGKNIGQFGN